MNDALTVAGHSSWAAWMAWGAATRTASSRGSSSRRRLGVRGEAVMCFLCCCLQYVRPPSALVSQKTTTGDSSIKKYPRLDDLI
jgi:hypothetical protein